MQLEVWFSKDGEQVRGLGFLEVRAHQQIGVHPNHEHLNATELTLPGYIGKTFVGGFDSNSVILGYAGSLRVERKRHDAQQVDVTGLDRLPRSFLDKPCTDGAVLRPDRYADPRVVWIVPKKRTGRLGPATV